jgi:hypothetical protein
MSRVQKGLRLLAEERVIEVEHPRVFRVQGDHDIYDVIIGPGIFRHCSCPFEGTTCSHVLSAQAFITHEKFKDDPLKGLPQG